jgi:hypothetical protein
MVRVGPRSPAGKGYRVGRQRRHGSMRRLRLHALQPQAFTSSTTNSIYGLRCAPTGYPISPILP